MKLGLNIKVYDLLTEYPFLIEYLITPHPHFKKLNNPVMLQTLGRFATLEKATSAVNIPANEFISGLAGEIKSETGQTVETESADTLAD